MAVVFPSDEWIQALKDHLNTDEDYAKTAKNWEGELLFDILPGGVLKEPMKIFLDLWHGKCRDIYFVSGEQETKAAFILKAPFDNFVKILKGELDPMQAMMTRKLAVKGSMSYMLRNVPTVLCFVRCAQDVTESVIGE